VDLYSRRKSYTPRQGRGEKDLVLRGMDNPVVEGEGGQRESRKSGVNSAGSRHVSYIVEVSRKCGRSVMKLLYRTSIVCMTYMYIYIWEPIREENHYLLHS